MPSPSFFTSVINSYLPEPHASLLNGILFGVPLKATKDFYQQLQIVGLLHIVVLSGINITILITIAGSITSFIGKKISILITILFIIIFIMFVGLQAPIIRAGIMGILTLVAVCYGRKNIALYSLFISALISVLFWPKSIHTISFQLSYAATLGIILLAKTNQVNDGNLFGRIKSFIWKELKPSLSAQLFTIPIIFLYFKQISLISPLSNLLVSFVIPPLMIFGFLTAILGKINFWLGIIPSFISYALLSYIIAIVDFLSKLNFLFLRF